MQYEETSNNAYFIDPNNPTETARLIEQDRLMTEQVGLFPEAIDTVFPHHGKQVCRVLDLACGPGGWALEVAFHLPKLDVTGVDLSASMVTYAIALAKSQDLTNVSFEAMDITGLLPFADASFDYIHARFLVGFMKPKQWLPLMQECKRLLVPGGMLCLTETEWALTNSLAYETLTARTSHALWLAEQSLSSDGRHIGITPLLSRFLQDAGYEQIQRTAHALDWSAGTDLNYPCMANCRYAFALLRPFVLKMRAIQEDEFDTLYEQMLIDIRLPAFCGIITPYVVWGKKPERR